MATARLLDPALRCNTRIKLYNGSIQEMRVGTEVDAAKKAAFIPGKDADGIYKILAVNHTGDTRGGPWYSDIACVLADPNARLPIGQIQRLRGGDVSSVPLAQPAGNVEIGEITITPGA